MNEHNPFFVNLRLSLLPNYYKWIYTEAEKYIGESVIDSGCGIGNLIPYLKNKVKVIGFDNDEEIVDFLKKKFSNLTNVSFYRVDLSTDNVFDLNLDKVDSIISLDVVEHIANDLDVVKKYYKLLKKGGTLIIKVPAFQSLFCKIDKDGGHFRRYNKKDWRGIASETGFKIVKLKYINMLGFVLYWWTGKVKKPKGSFSQSVDDIKMKLMNSILPFYSFCEKFVYKPFGLSVLAILKK